MCEGVAVIGVVLGEFLVADAGGAFNASRGEVFGLGGAGTTGRIFPCGRIFIPDTMGKSRCVHPIVPVLAEDAVRVEV